MPLTKFSIHREGHGILAVSAVVLAFSAVIFHYLSGLSDSWKYSAPPALILLGFLAYFFRIPQRELRQSERQIIAPADGRVVVIEQVEEKEYFGDRRIQVSIFMSPANVHVNRAPLSGLVRYQKYHPGKYLVAWHPKSSEKNERNSLVIANGETEIMIRQIAGKVARKIRWYLEEGDEAQQGCELGFIKLGSRVDLFLPIGTRIEVDLKQKVKGGLTVIGSLPEETYL
jgi:phosphatidylserine decarboxylase